MSLADLTSPTAVKMAMKRCDDMGRDAFLKRYGFEQAREYHLTYRVKTYDSKAIAGVAHGIQHPSRGSLKSSEYRGGAAKSAAGYRLFKLGFVVNKLVRPKNDWALEQCEKTAIAYFSCLKAKQSSKTFNRAATVRQVAEQIKQPIGAVDSKFQNIDAILSRAGLPRLNQVTADSAEGLLRLVVLDPLATWWNDLDMRGSVAANQRAVEEVFIDVRRGGGHQLTQVHPIQLNCRLFVSTLQGRMNIIARLGVQERNGYSKYKLTCSKLLVDQTWQIR